MKINNPYLDIHTIIYAYLGEPWTYEYFPRVASLVNVPIIIIKELISPLMILY